MVMAWSVFKLMCMFSTAMDVNCSLHFEWSWGMAPFQDWYRAGARGHVAHCRLLVR